MTADLSRLRLQKATIRDRHTGAVLVTLPIWGDSLHGLYLGFRVPKDFRSADLRAADLSEADVTGRDLSDADLTGANLTATRYDVLTRWPAGYNPQLHGAVQVPVDLKGAKLVGTTHLEGLDLTDADLRGADLSDARLRNAILLRASMRGANLSGADLLGADLAGADVRNIRYDETTVWPEGFDIEQRLTQDTPEVTAPALEQTVTLLKALADATRLRLIGLLSREEHTVEELASALGLTEPTVSHHLSRLKTLGLVNLRAEGVRHLYRADTDQLTGYLQALPSQLVESARGGVDTRTFESKILGNYFENNRLKHIPFHSTKKLHVILRRLSEAFEHGERYPEKEVNARLGRFHEDFATLRRHMVDYRYMARENGIYWRLVRTEE